MQIQNTQTLLEALAPHVAGASKTTLKSLIADRRVKVGDTVIHNPKYQVKEGEKIVVLPKEKTAGPNIKIYYEDSHLIVVYKPENLLSVAQDTGMAASLHGYLKNYCKQKITPVHRLDKGTSGVLVFAKSEQAKEGLKELFFNHDINREYIGIVTGHVPLDGGKWVDFLEEDTRGVVYIGPESEISKEAITHFQVIDRNQTHTLLRFKLETGRKHQIRVQASSRDFPLVGDETYGGPRHKRILLHAEKLEFVHPVTGKMMKFYAPLPPSFKV